jgi:hypothetical protein
VIPRHHGTINGTMQPWCNLALDINLIEPRIINPLTKKRKIHTAGRIAQCGA